MGELGARVSQSVEDQHLARRVGQVVVAPQYVVDPHRRVVDDHREIVGRAPVPANDHRVSQLGEIELEPAAQTVVEGDPISVAEIGRRREA